MSNKYYSPEGNLEVWEEKPQGYYTEDEWAELHPAPELPEPTVEEKLEALDADYNQQKADLLTAYQTAMLYGDTDTMDSLKADLVALDEQYDEDYEKIVGEG
jgi:ankyrin repeat protein